MKVVCTVCRFERVTPREQPADKPSLPVEGDFWLCSQCGQLHRFTGSFVIDNRTLSIGELFVRKADDAELEQIEPELRVSLPSKRVEIIRQAVR